jgi:hypothetical protein
MRPAYIQRTESVASPAPAVRTETYTVSVGLKVAAKLPTVPSAFSERPS